MTDEPREPQEPVFGRDPAPDHGPTFWADLEHGLARTAPYAAPEHPTLVMAVESDEASHRQVRHWPVLAAAAVVLLVALGVIAARGLDSGDGDTADVVSGEVGSDDGDDGQVVPLDGPNNDEPNNNDTGDVDAASAANPASEAEGSVVVISPDPTPESLPLEFERALGNDDLVVYGPIAGELPNDARFLATWEERRLSWFSAAEETDDCHDLTHTQIYYVNEARIAQPLRDPQLHFSGDIDHFTLRPDIGRAAWLVSCGAQLEFYVAELADTGQVVSIDLVWLGSGQPANSLILWDGPVVSLSSLNLERTPFFVDYDLSSGRLSGDGVLGPAPSESGHPIGRSSIPVGASADADFTYWNAQDPDGQGGCQSTSNTLWVRDSGAGADGAVWSEAVIDNSELGVVTAFALQDRYSQVAFADACQGVDGRVFIGTQRADGRISNLRELDLSPYVPGFADEVFWVDDSTLRIETDNSAFDVHSVRFDYRVRDGIVVELN